MNTNTTNAFAPTTAEAQANDAKAGGSGLTILHDTYKKGTPTHKLAEGNNWIRCLNVAGNPWVARFELITVKKDNILFKAAAPALYGEFDLFQHVQINLYQQARDRMYTTQNKNGFRFSRKNKAAVVCSFWENTLSDFGVLEVSAGGQIYDATTKSKTYKTSWGDGLLNLPEERIIDPMSPGPGAVRWGAIADLVAGRLIMASVQNAGTKEQTVAWVPQDKTMPLGEWVPTGGAKINPAYEGVLQHVPALKDVFNRLNVQEQATIIMQLVPDGLKAVTSSIINKYFTDKNSPFRVEGPAPFVDPFGPKPKVVQLAIPQEQPVAPIIMPVDVSQPVVEVFKGAYPALFAEVGFDILNRLATKGILNMNTLTTMSTIPAASLKLMAV